MTYVFWYLTKTIIFLWLIDRSVINYQLLCICHKSNGVYPTVYCHSKFLYKCFYVCLYLYFHWRSKYREKRFGFQLKRLIPPPFCTCPKPGHVCWLVYVFVFSYVRWFEVKGRCSYCSCYLFSQLKSCCKEVRLMTQFTGMTIPEHIYGSLTPAVAHFCRD